MSEELPSVSQFLFTKNKVHNRAMLEFHAEVAWENGEFALAARLAQAVACYDIWDELDNIRSALEDIASP